MIFDQCCFGLRDPQSGKPHKKRTRVITTNEIMKTMLDKQCSGDHEHQKLEGMIRLQGKWVSRTRCAQVYPKRLVEVMATAIRRKLRQQDMEVLAVEKLSEKKESIKELVQRCHVNLGHPSKERFLHMLQSAGASEETIKMAKEFQCSLCLSKKSPASHPVVSLNKQYGFNEVVSMDTFEIPCFPQSKKVKMLNICCEGTGMQLVCPLWGGATAKNTRKAYRKYWTRWAGRLPRIKTDGGKEFDKEFQEGCDLDNTCVAKSAAEAPWQNGFCEKQGGLWKSVFFKSKEECQPRTRQEYNELFDQINQNKNAMPRKHGFSPVQHVFGCNFRLPAVLCDEGVHEQQMHGMLHGVDSYTRAQEIRQAARKALVEQDDVENVRKAVQSRSRTRKTTFETGEYVYYWRRDPECKAGQWKGPARIIGTYSENSKYWVEHGNKVLRCCPEQLRSLTEDQRRAIGATPTALLAKSPSKRGAHVFTDISAEGYPPDEAGEPGECQVQPKRRRVELDGEEQEEGVGASHARNIEMETEDGETGTPTAGHSNSQAMSDDGANTVVETGDAIREVETGIGETNGMGVGVINSGAEESNGRRDHESSYGPIRNNLNQALRRSLDILDHGTRNLPPRSPLQTQRVDSAENYMVDREWMTTDDTNEVFAVNRETQELQDGDLTAAERQEVDKGKTTEWQKLLKIGSVRIVDGKEYHKVMAEHPKERILESRFVKTRRENPNEPGKTQIKCRWCIKGFRDPDLYDVEKQSPTLSLDSLMMCLQIIAGKKWDLIISDVEGAFLQGEPMVRNKGKIYVRLPKDGVPGYGKECLAELVKCVYGLCDAPRSWWESFSKTLKNLGMRQSELDPCTYYWYHEGELQGLVALHVDDMIIGGSEEFHEKVLFQLRQVYPFKHWKTGGGKFLGRNIRQQGDGSIVCDQRDCQTS